MSQQTITTEEYRRMAGKAKKTRKTKADYLKHFMATPPPSHTIHKERTRQVAVSLRLPLAPSVNQYRAIFDPPKGRARLITSAEGRAYVEAVGRFWLLHFAGWPPEPITGRVRLLVVCYMARNGVADLSNRWKALEDALTACGAWKDDGQIDDERMVRGPLVRGTGAMDVQIAVIED